jgi:hypothetical protein
VHVDKNHFTALMYDSEEEEEIYTRHSERRRRNMEIVFVSGFIYRSRALLSCVMHAQASSSSLYLTVEIRPFSPL